MERELDNAKDHEVVNIGSNQNKQLKIGLLLNLKVKNLSTGTKLNPYCVCVRERERERERAQLVRLPNVGHDVIGSTFTFRSSI